MEHLKTDNNNENGGQGDQLDFIPKKTSRTRRSKIIITRMPDKPGTASRKPHRPKSRIPYNPLHSTPRNYIPTNELEYQFRGAVMDPPEGNVIALPPSGESIPEINAKCQKEKRHPKSTKTRSRSVSPSPVTLYFLGFELMERSKAEIEGNLFYFMLQFVDRFVDRISSSVFVAMAIFMMFCVTFIYDFAEPLGSIEKAMGDLALFNDRSSSK